MYDMKRVEEGMRRLKKAMMASLVRALIAIIVIVAFSEPFR